MIDLAEDNAGSSWAGRAIAAGALLALLGVGAYQWGVRPEPLDAAGCPRDAMRALEAVAVDTTDPLLMANPARAEVAFQQVLERLPGGGALIVGALDADVAAEFRPAFLRCAPDRVEDANPFVTPVNSVKRARARYENEARVAFLGLAARPDATRSPLVEQITKLVTDARLRTRSGARRTLTVFSDLLEAGSSGASSVYRGTLRLPRQPARVLAGWHVRFVQTTNPRDRALQTQTVREEWRRWALAAGAASVTFEGSGFVSEGATS